MLVHARQWIRPCNAHNNTKTERLDKLFYILVGLQYRETISLVVFGFGSLEMTAVLDLQFVQLVLLGQLIECRGKKGRSGRTRERPAEVGSRRSWDRQYKAGVAKMRNAVIMPGSF